MRLKRIYIAKLVQISPTGVLDALSFLHLQNFLPKPENKKQEAEIHLKFLNRTSFNW